MQDQSVVVRLYQKVDEVLSRLDQQNEELGRLRNENALLRAECEAKQNEINRLAEEHSSKDREMEGVIHRMDERLYP